jgi:hypothetical protein
MSSSDFVCWRDGLPVHGARSGWRHALGGRTGAIPAHRKHYPVPVTRALYDEAFDIAVTRERFLEIKAHADQVAAEMRRRHPR